MSIWNEQIDQIQSALRKTIASKAHISAANSSILFGGYMGCGWKRWKDEVGIERLKIVQAAWQEKTTVFAKVMRGAVWSTQLQSSADGLILETRGNPMYRDHQGTSQVQGPPVDFRSLQVTCGRMNRLQAATSDACLPWMHT